VSSIVTLAGKTPILGDGVFVAPGAVVIGDVVLGEQASVWFGCVLRGDVGAIRIGKRTNIQDLACIHMTDGVTSALVGDEVTVGHGAILHGCTVGDGALIGMGVILLDGVVVGEGSVIAAGTLVPPRMQIPAGSIVKGNPAKILGQASEEQRLLGRAGAAHYVENAKRYLPLTREER